MHDRAGSTGQPERRRTHDYVRHGTRDLLVTLEVNAGIAIGEVHGLHRRAEFRHSLDTVHAGTPPELDLTPIRDDASTRETALVKRCLLKHPRVHLHRTPTSVSWINLVECWLSLFQRRALRRAEFASHDALEAALPAMEQQLLGTLLAGRPAERTAMRSPGPESGCTT